MSALGKVMGLDASGLKDPTHEYAGSVVVHITCTLEQSRAWAELWGREVEASAWVAIEDGLPKRYESVIVVRRGKHESYLATYRGEAAPGERRRGAWEVRPWGVCNDVTHWQHFPLPPTPQDQASEQASLRKQKP